MPHTLYRLFCTNGELLYVGRTLDVRSRIKDHRVQKSWWSEVAQISLEHFASLEEVAAAERAAIADENPKWNVVRYRNAKPPLRAARRRRYLMRTAA